MSDSEFGAALDAWLTDPRMSGQALYAFCVNKSCPERNGPVSIWATTEYGATRWQPDDCPVCGKSLEEDPMEVEEA